MQSPLVALLQEVAARWQPPSGASPAAAAEAAWQAAQETGSHLSDVLAVLLQHSVQGCVPDEEHVASCKQRGTAAFGRVQHRQAAALFSEALRYCDESSTAGAQLAARLYCNRALCLSRLQPPALQAALADSSAAIACDPSFAKAWYRRARTKQAIGQQGASSSSDGRSSALEDARHALHLLREQGSQDTAQTEALVAQLEQAEQQQQQQAEPEAAAAAEGPSGPPAPAPDGSPAAEAASANGHASRGEIAAGAGVQGLLAQAGQQLGVAERAGQGRCLVAADALAAGTNVLKERPFVHALTKRGRRSVCATCLAPLASVVAPFYCRRCPVAQYCSGTCRDADPFHVAGGPECGRPWPVLLPTEVVAALRLVRRLRGAAGSADAATASQVAALGTHWADMPAQDVAELAALAVVTHAAWQRAVAEVQADAGAGAAAAGGSVEASAARQRASRGDSCGIADIAAGDILEALCRLQINGLAVVPAERRGSEDRLGLALYPIGSLMNHACSPNMATRFEGGVLVVRAVEPLAAGEPLLHCYGPQAGEMTTAQRQAMLQQHYFFTCRCRACSGVTSGDLQHVLGDAAPAGLRCPASSGSGSSGRTQCEGTAMPAVAVPPGVLHRYELPPGSGACCTCGSRLDTEQWQGQVLPELQAAAEAHAAAMAALVQGQQQGMQPQQEQAAAAAAAAQQAICTLRQCLRLRQQHLHPHNLLLGATHDALAHAWLLAGNAQASAQHLRHSLTVLQHAYPPGSTAAAFQQRELSRMLRLAAADAAPASNAAAVEQLLGEAREAEEAADAVLEVHFGAGAAGAM